MANLKTEMDFQKLLACAKSNEENFNSLLRLMYRNVVVPFLGAGFSANFGYPGWTAFLEELAENMEEKADVHKYLHENPKQYEKAASKVQEAYGSSFNYILSQKFGDHVYKQKVEGTEDLELLPELFPSLILTTNFDEVIELMYSKVNMEYITKLTPSTLQDSAVIIRRVANGQPTLIKLHGDVAKEEFVLAEKEYCRAYGCDEVDFTRPMPALLRDILRSKIVLFLGCSLENDRTMELINSIRSEGCISFALLQLPEETKTKTESEKTETVPPSGSREDGASVHTAADNKNMDLLKERSEFLHQRNIIPIWYPHGEYQYLKIFLRELNRLMGPMANHSVTVAQKSVKQLLEDGRKWNAEGDHQRAFAAYSQVESLVKTNPVAFDINARIRCLDEVRRFYGASDNGYKRRDIVKDILSLVKEEYSDKSLEYAYWLHGLVYGFERYRYYTLMIKFFLRASEIIETLEAVKKTDGITILLNNGVKVELSIDDVKAHLYDSLGYTYYLSGNDDEACVWYSKAEKLLSEDLEFATRAFVTNGLSRYYEIVDADKPDKHKNSIEKLNDAMTMRKEIVTMNIDPDASQHLLNTYSNLIRIYTKSGQCKTAMELYETAMGENDAWKRLPYPADAKMRLMEDKGDILMESKDYTGAADAYREALETRKFLHWADDITVADTYTKMAYALLALDDKSQVAAEYLIQAYVLKRRENNQERQDNGCSLSEIMDKLKPLVTDSLEARLKAQDEMMMYRYGNEVDNREQDLIDYYADIIGVI